MMMMSSHTSLVSRPCLRADEGDDEGDDDGDDERRLGRGGHAKAAISSSERMLVMHWDSALALSHFVQWLWSDLTCALTRGDIAEVVDAGVRDRLDGVGPDGVHEALEDVRGAR